LTNVLKKKKIHNLRIECSDVPNLTNVLKKKKIISQFKD